MVAAPASVLMFVEWGCMARIILVEDEPITATDLERVLNGLGHDVAGWFDNGEDAVAEAAKLKPDLVLMDIRLRGKLTGIEAAALLRAEGGTPLVFLTAFADQETVDRACDTEPYGYLLKPFTDRSVATAVQVALSRARAERATFERERWVSAALQGAGEALIAVDDSGAVRFLNRHAEALLHVHEKDALGRDARSLVRFADDGSGDRSHPFDLAIREGRVTSSTGRGLVLSGGEAGPDVAFSAAPVLSASGTTLGAVLVFREPLAPSGAERGAPLAALAGLSQQLSHEINNPLTCNLGALHLALRELDRLRAMSALGSLASDASAEQREQQLLRIERLLRDAQTGAARVADVMHELGAFSLSEAQSAPLQPVELLDLAIGLSGIEDEARVRLVRRVEGAAIPMVRGNKWQLSRLLALALQNLLEPARPDGGEHALELWLGTDARGWVELRARARHAPITAAWVDPANSAPAPESLGPISVGMTLAEHVVASLGGTLVVREEREGRLFTLHLPPMDVAASPSKLETQRSASQPRGSVLVVDDEPMIGAVLQITLEPYYDVTFVTSAESALALLEKGDAFDVILSDLSMPGMDGQQLYEHLRKVRPDVARRMVIMTGGARNAKAARFLDDMRERRIDKPFRSDLLLPLLAERVREGRQIASRALS